ncbi:hypothetical protein PRZ48_014766 [Zasmidium cellare]|uniref:Uncharacterized protein n=1 Tax=Zasmidium cellare TaxID=395010 RepID=A0ABR0DZQ9_ZASCE|nr:hypothetical protein PRZ48_014766 [Zasmidium cellare]
MFIVHMEQSYMAFCKPQCAGDEFLLTQNAFGISEGPNSGGMDPATGELDREILTEWHNFAPLSPTLLVILRNNCLPGNDGGTTIEQSRMYDLLRFMHPSPEEAGSMLQDLPVRRSTLSYLNQKSGRVVTSNHHEPSPTDRYEFECFELGSPHVDLINSLFLEEALPTKSIVFKRDTVAARAIHKYLEDPRPGFKAACRNDTDKSWAAGPMQFEILTLPIEDQHPLDFAGHMARWVTFQIAIEIEKHHPRLLELYQSLGGSAIETPRGMQQWYNDVQQSAKITFFDIKIDSALSAMALDAGSKRQCKIARMIFLATLRPRFIWLFIKALRNLDKLDPDDFARLRTPLQCEGVEDEVVRNVVDVPDVVQSNVGALRDRLALRNSKGNVLKVDPAGRELGEGQLRIERLVGNVGERGSELLARDSVADNVESSRLGETEGGAGVGAETPVEVLEIEGIDRVAAGQGGEGVQGEVAQVEEVERAGCSAVLGWRVREDAGDAVDGAEDDDTAVA